METKSRRNVFLFGAGAVIDWGGPYTSDLTQLILKTGFYTKDGERISQKIFNALIASGHHEDEVNFETILNVVEELIVYYSKLSASNKTPSLLKPFLLPDSGLENYLNFEIEGNANKHPFKLHIPGSQFEKESQVFSKNNETPEQHFFQLLLANLIDGIIGKVSKYAGYATNRPSLIDNPKNERKNQFFYNWMSGLLENGILRIYTLNYESLFKRVLESRGMQFFEGFEPEHNGLLLDRIPAECKRILTDFDCNIHYNLHGSIYWKVEPYDKQLLPNYQYYLTSSSNPPSNQHTQPFLQIERGKNIMLTNIITGYQKTQKVTLSPFRQMYASFDRDCILANEIFIIGYSFGDAHINECLKIALRCNPEVHITIVEPYFIRNNFDYKLALEFFPHSTF